MPGEHFTRVGIHERVEFQVRRALSQHRENRRGKQYIAMMAKLHHQRPPQAGEFDGIRRDRDLWHGRHNSRDLCGETNPEGKRGPRIVQPVAHARFDRIRRRLLYNGPQFFGARVAICDAS